MSEQKKKLIFAVILASISVIILAEVSITFFPAQPTSNSQKPNSAPMIPATGLLTIEIPISSTVELNSSQGFSASLPAGEPNQMPVIPLGVNTTAPAVPTSAQASPLLVLAPGGTGSVPFQVYTSSTNETVNVSLTADLWSPPDPNGVIFSVSPSNFAINPGEKVTSVLNVTASKNAPTAFYLPYVDVRTNSSGILGTQITMPDLLVSSATPTCLFLTNEQQSLSGIVSAPAPSSFTNTPIGNASAAAQPSIALPPTASSTPTPSLLFPPTVNLSPRQTATVMYACLTQYNLNFNATAPPRLSAKFSANPMDIIFGSTSGKMYSLTVTADINSSSGIYKVNATGTLGTDTFDASFYVEVK